MSASNLVPYGLKSLLECTCRATLLAQPDNIAEFLHTHVDEMTHFRDKDRRDTKEVAFQYQEQWENDFLQKNSRGKETPKTAPDENPSPTPSVSSASSVSSRPPREVRWRRREVKPIRIPSEQDTVGITAEEISPSSKPGPPPPRRERVKTCRVPSVRKPRQKETKPSLPSAWTVLPPIPQKAPLQISKQLQGQKSTKGRGSGVYTCHLSDCPYHKPKQGSAVDRKLGPVRTSKQPTVKRDLGLQRSLAEPSTFELQVPYRPKGGPIVDPELAPRRTRAGPSTNRTPGAQSIMLYGRQGTVYSGQGSVSVITNSSDLSQLSLEGCTHTCPHVTQSVHIIRYRCMRVRCSECQPHSAKSRIMRRNEYF